MDRASVADGVRQFYERHPYPPPVGDLTKYRRVWQDQARRRADHHLHWPARAYREDLSVLIAGCGTSQAAKHAMRWPGARVTAIDFSATSVRHTETLKRKYDLGNLQVQQLPLEEVGKLDATFDQIVCTGVLHHLPDPAAGLAALREVLAPDGAMHLMVYAPYGRTGIYMLQEFFRRIGVQAGAELGQLLGALEALPPGHPLRTVLHEAPDFRDEAALADALLHPQDRAYSVPQLFELLAGARLTFGRWVRQAPYSAGCGVVQRIPQADLLARLPAPDQAAALELFRGTMVRHSLIAHRQDQSNDQPENRSDAARTISFAGDAWPRYVPLRMPDTIAVGERLPAGSAAVLINRGHTYTDLFLPIDAREKRFFDAINGERTIAAIAEEISGAGAGAPLEQARAFFDRLHRYDQVVFDASAA